MFDWPVVAWLWVISGWVIRLVMLPIVTHRRSPTAALAWLMIIFFQPWFGLLMYLLIGENRLPRRRVKRHVRRLQTMAEVDRLALQLPHIIRPPIDPEYQDLAALTERIGGARTVGGNSVEPMIETHPAIDRLIDDIEASQHHVHLLFYIFEDDTAGRRAADALGRAVERGVKCRVLVDAVGSRGLFRRLGPSMQQRGIELHALLPANPLRRRLARLDLRNHRKLAVIDGKIAHTGSQNIVDPAYGRRGMVWHDIMVRLTGPVVLQLQQVFEEDWFSITSELFDQTTCFPTPAVTGDVAIQTVPSGPTYQAESFQPLIIAAIQEAREHVIISSPYLVPDEPFMVALQLAVLRGVEVDVIVPRRSDHPLVSAAGRAYFDDLLDAGVRIHRHDQGLLHAKTVTVDDAFAIISSANVDIRSFYLNFELSLLLYGPSITSQLRFIQRQYIDQSQPLDQDAWSRRPRIHQVFDNIAKLLSPLL